MAPAAQPKPTRQTPLRPQRSTPQPITGRQRTIMPWVTAKSPPIPSAVALNCFAYTGRRNGSMVRDREPSMTGSLSGLSAAVVPRSPARAFGIVPPSQPHGTLASFTAYPPWRQEPCPQHEHKSIRTRTHDGVSRTSGHLGGTYVLLLGQRNAFPLTARTSRHTDRSCTHRHKRVAGS